MRWDALYDKEFNLSRPLGNIGSNAYMQVENGYRNF